MITAQQIYDSFARYKQDVSDVDNDVFLEWVQFTTRFIYDKAKRVDAGRFVKTQSYNVVIPPQSHSLPDDFQDLNQTVCGIYKYDTRKKLNVTFDDGGDTDITFSDSGGISAYNSAQKVQGGSSRGFTSDAAATLLLSFGTALNWTSFGDNGSISPTNDYISIWLYVGNTVPTSATIEFSTLNTGASVGVNQFSYTKASFVAGWQNIKVLKSAFTITGAPSWSSLGYLRLIYSGGDATTSIYWDKLDLVESPTNGNDETDKKLGITGYGSKSEGYYLNASNVVFTGDNTNLVDRDYVMRYIPIPPTIDALADYISVDGTVNTAAIVEDRHLEYMVKAVDVLYGQWDEDPNAESVADFRFVRALGELLDGYNRTPQISIMRNPSRNF